MVVGLNEGLLTPLGQIFPVEGAWGSLIGILVGIRVMLYALGAKTDHENPLRELGSWVLYFFVLFYFGPYVLAAILALHFAKKMGYLKLEFLEKLLPEEESASGDTYIFIFSALFAWLYSSGTLGVLDSVLPLNFLGNIWGWIIVLLVMLFFVRPKADTSSAKQALISVGISLAVVLLALGPDALHVLLLFLLVKPFLFKFKLTKKAVEIPGKIRQTAEASAAAPEAIAAKRLHAEEEGLEEGVLNKVKDALGKYAHNVSEDEKHELDELRESIDKRLGAVAGAVENLSAKQQVQHDVEVKELEDKYEGMKDSVPSTWKFILALTVAVINDILDLMGIGEIPVVGTILDILTALFVLPVVIPVINSAKQGKGMGALVSLIFPAGELAGIGPLAVIDIFPLWTIGIIALWLFTKFGSTAKEIKQTKKELQALNSESTRPAFALPGYTKKLVLAFVAIIIVLFFVLPQFNIMPGVAQATENAVTYFASGQAAIGAQQLGQKSADFLKNAITAPTKWWKKQIAVATGDYYTGQVDASSNRKLGVFLENLRPSEKNFVKD
ncbi:hypothetical protein KY311_02655, partial [Candidatus Woesearchaeota archaeon]|nr:hypothetical protein [Candidatus Woesearchaeota archaeon]